MASGRLADLASFAGVSEATVSRVLNDKPGVAPATRQAVMIALDVLGYERPSKLRRNSAGLVGLIVPELTNPIFPVFAQEVETHLAAAGYTPVLCTQVAGGVHEDEYVQMLLGLGVASIIFISGYHADTKAETSRYDALRQRGLPIVMVNGYREGVEAPFISTDDVAGMRLAVQHLRDLGHRRIGLATGPERYVPVLRKIEGFALAMRECAAEAGDPVPTQEELDALVQTTLFTVEGGVAAGRDLLDAGVTGLVCGSDLMALGVIRAVRQAGLRVPQDVSVIGSDDSQVIGFTDPPLTTVRQDVAGMSQAAVQAVLDEINGGNTRNREFLFAPELILRRSTGAAPAPALTGVSATD